MKEWGGENGNRNSEKLLKSFLGEKDERLFGYQEALVPKLKCEIRSRIIGGSQR